MQNKIKIYEIAQELNILDDEVIEKAKELNIVLKSSQSVVTFEEAEKIKKYILDTSLIYTEKKMDYSAIEKRLKLLSLALEYEDYDIVEILISKVLEINNLDKKIIDIITNVEFNLRFHQFEYSLNEINVYLNKKKQSSTVVKYEDIELLELKKELKKIEIKFQELVEQKTEYLNDIEEFNTQYNLHLGEMIRTILNLRREILYKKTIKHQKLKEQFINNKNICDETKETIQELKNTIDELEDILKNIDEEDENYEEIKSAYDELKEELEKIEDELQIQEKELEETKEKIEEDEIVEEEYEEANSTYEEFDNEYEHIKDTQKDIQDLNNEDKKELKLLYKKAAKLCHPDIVSAEFKEKAHEIMQSLNDAYSKKDITQVRKILLSLENGITFNTLSNDINDKELLLGKIKEFERNIYDLEKEIEDIKSDDTYTTISTLEDWDEYFEELKTELQKEKDKLEAEAQEILEEKEEIEEWIQKLWNWADENNISNSKLSRKKENLLATTTIDLTDVKLNYLSKEITYIKNLQELILWGCYLKYLPKDIVKLDKLRKLNLRGNPELAASPSQFHWIDELSKKSTVFKDSIRTVREETVDMFAGEAIEKTKETIKQVKEEFRIIQKENSDYSKYIQSIENIKFEKIRKYCENLSRDNNADDMQKYLGLNGKMYKALIYSSLEVFIEELNGKNITLIDWGCNQGIASMLVLDYIKEKQLDIKVERIILIDDEEKSLSRAIAQVEALIIDKSEIIAINTNDNDCLNKIKNIQKDYTFNLFANNKMPIDFLDIDYDLFDESYFMCLSNKNDNFINEVYENISIFKDVQDMSIRNDKIGKFKRYERIFKLLKTIDIDIDEDEIPF